MSILYSTKINKEFFWYLDRKNLQKFSMRFVNKYKSYDKLFFIFDKFPLRVLKFKSTKWKRVQRLLILKKSKQKKLLRGVKPVNSKKKVRSFHKKTFFDTLLIKVGVRTWYRVEKYYENGRRIKNIFHNAFDKSVLTSHFRTTLKFTRKASNTLYAYSSTLLKPEFRLDILLWRLKFFNSSYQASQAIAEQKVAVNNKFVQGNFFLSKGDIIVFCPNFKLNNLNFHKKEDKTLFSRLVSTSIEVDYYSNSIIILKNWEDLGKEDLYLSLKDSYSLKKIKDYI